MLWLLALGCAYEPTLVNLSGIALDGRLDDALGLSEAQITTHDLAMVQIDQAITDGRGWFSVQAVADGVVFMEVSAEGYVPTSFNGGTAPAVDSEFADGAIWAWQEDALGEVRALFDGCEGALDDGPLIIGDIRLGVPGYTPDDGEWDHATTGYAVAYDSEGTAYPACYREAENGSYGDPSATRTGISGSFAIFDAPTGPVTVVVGYELSEGEAGDERTLYVRVPEGGVVPMYSVLLSLVQ